MSTKIQTKRSSVANKAPQATDLEVGELAVNLADHKLYTKDGSNAVILLADGNALMPAGASAGEFLKWDNVRNIWVPTTDASLDSSGNLTVTGKLIAGTAPTADNDVVTKKYMEDNAVVQNPAAGISQTITAAAATDTPLTLTGATGQTADVLSVTTEGPTVFRAVGTGAAGSLVVARNTNASLAATDGVSVFMRQNDGLVSLFQTPTGNGSIDIEGVDTILHARSGDVHIRSGNGKGIKFRCGDSAGTSRMEITKDGLVGIAGTPGTGAGTIGGGTAKLQVNGDAYVAGNYTVKSGSKSYTLSKVDSVTGSVQILTYGSGDARNMFSGAGFTAIPHNGNSIINTVGVLGVNTIKGVVFSHSSGSFNRIPAVAIGADIGGGTAKLQVDGDVFATSYMSGATTLGAVAGDTGKAGVLATSDGVSGGIIQVANNRNNPNIVLNQAHSAGRLFFVYGPTGSSASIDISGTGAGAASTLAFSSAMTAAGAAVTSDIHIKTDIADVPIDVSVFKHLKPKKYIKDGQPEVGLIAQELEQHFPDAVITSPLTAAWDSAADYSEGDQVEHKGMYYEALSDVQTGVQPDDVWTPAVEASDAVLDDEGAEVTPVVQAVEASGGWKPTGQAAPRSTQDNSILYEQKYISLGAVNAILFGGMAAMAEKMEALEARLAALETN